MSLNRTAGKHSFEFGRGFAFWLPLARSPPVQNPTVPLGRAPGTTITGRHQNLRDRRRRGRSVEVAGRGIGRTDPLLDHPYHFEDPRRITHPGAHLVTRRHNRRRLRRPIVDSHVPTSTRRGGVRPGLCQPDCPQPPIHAGRLHNIHHGPPTGRGQSSTGRTNVGPYRARSRRARRDRHRHRRFRCSSQQNWYSTSQ